MLLLRPTKGGAQGMVRRLFGKVMWLGRATSALVGLAVLLALGVGAANSALAHTNVDNKLFHLGHSNRVGTATTPGTPTALVSTLSDAVKSALVVQNKSGGPALSLGVLDGKAPLTVNAEAGTAKNLSADELDGMDSSQFAYGIDGSAEFALDADRLDGLNALEFQRRVGGQCAEGSSIRSIGEFGAVTCEADDGGGKAPDSELLDGKDSTQFANATHAHSGADITSGTVAEARVDATVTRDAEVMPIVKANDGANSGVDADTLDGKTSSDFAKAYKSTVVVSPVGTDAQNGTALVNALSGITDASASKPYLLYIEPGTYYLGSSSLQMKQGVDIQGAGELNTRITSNQASCTAGTVNGDSAAELRFLMVRNNSTGECGIGVYNDFANPRLTQVTAESIGPGTNRYGVYNANSSSPTMTNVTATAFGGTYNYGVYNASSSAPTISHSRLTGTTNSLYHDGGTARVALTQFWVGTISKPSGTLKCFNNYDSNLFAVTCP